MLQIGTTTAHVGDTFTVDITCVPSEPIKAWELKVCYDNETLQLLNITEGNFFGDYQTFYISETSLSERKNAFVHISNTTQALAYALVVGKGNVSAQGLVCSLVFEAVGIGEAVLGLYDTGVCNETQYLELTTQNGSVKVLRETFQQKWRTAEVGQNNVSGWNTFGSGIWNEASGWVSFENTVPTIQGYSTFRTMDRQKDDYTLISALAIIILITAIVVIFLKR